MPSGKLVFYFVRILPWLPYWGLFQFIFMSTKYFSVHRFHQDVRVDIAKGLSYPHLRGFLLPSFDRQIFGGLAINWLGVRVRIGK